MAWQPQLEQLTQLAHFLRDSLNGLDPTAQKNAEQMIQQAKRSPDINNYLVYLCVTSSTSSGLTPDAYHQARSAAAIMLKNNIKTGYKSIPDTSQAFIKSNILQGLRDGNAQIRSFVGSVITEVVKQGGILGWPQVLPELVSVASTEGATSTDAQDGAMGAIMKICEDNRKALDQEYQTQRPLAFLLPKLVDFTQKPNPRVRSRALSTINVFLREPVALTIHENIQDILPAIIRLSQDTNDEVRRHVCRSFSMLADALPQVLLPYVEGIVDYTISQQKDVQNEELALDAAEFFFEASSNAQLREALGPHLAKIIPVLLDCMIYSEDDQLRLEGEAEDDANIEDEAKDIKPQFAAAKNSRMGDVSSQQSNGQAKPAVNGYAYEDDDEFSEGEIDEDDLDEGDPEIEWNLRKCSAAALDSFASHFHGPVFESTLPWLIVNLKHQDWPNREAAVLAVGAIGPGCMEHIVPNLPELIPYMLSLLSDPQPVVRRITCWSVNRFSSWAAKLPDKSQFFEPIMDGMLRCMLDGNKKVQEAAASAFATLEESASDELTPYCNVILQQFVKCFNQYKDKNVYVLYDCVQTLAEHSSPTLAQPENVNLLMPTLMARWNKVQDQSREMFPLLECLSFVAQALGASFGPYAEPLFMRCMKLIQQNLEDSFNASAEDSFVEAPDKDFLVTSLDLLSSTIQAIPEKQSSELASSSNPNMFQLLAYCMRDTNNDVRQSAYALLGDCASYIFSQLQPFLPALIETLIGQLDPSEAQTDQETAFRVINNACWSGGEIAMRHGERMSPYVDRLLTKLAVIMISDDIPESVNENAAIAIGRLGIGCHQQLAPHLANLAPPFLHQMQKVGWTDEKGHAYKGFNNIVLDNPEALEKCLLDFFKEMANAPGVFLTSMQGDGPLEGFERVLVKYRQMIGANFDNFLHNLPPAQEQALRQLYSF